MDIYVQAFEHVISGLPMTMWLTVASILLAIGLGILLLFGLRAKPKAVRTIFRVLASFLKAIPILVFLYVFNSSIDVIMGGLDQLLPFYTYNIRKPPTLLFAILALALSYTPYMSDMMDTALKAIPVGQYEACDAAGFTAWQKMTRIIIPQGIVVAIPNFGNHFVNLLKATSLTCMVTIMEMMGEARNFATYSQHFLESYITCALVYWGVFLIFEQLFRLLERKAGSYLRPGTPVAKKN
jgi:ABC-type amino acid transport system permease subunit